MRTIGSKHLMKMQKTSKITSYMESAGSAVEYPLRKQVKTMNHTSLLRIKTTAADASPRLREYPILRALSFEQQKEESPTVTFEARCSGDTYETQERFCSAKI